MKMDVDCVKSGRYLDWYLRDRMERGGHLTKLKLTEIILAFMKN